MEYNKKIDVEESKKQGTMVYVDKGEEDVIYNDEAYDDEGEIYSKNMRLTLFVIAQVLFFPIICYVSMALMNSGKNESSLISYIVLSFLYAIALIVCSKFLFSEYTYGTLIKRSTLVCGGQSLVLMLFMILFLVYPMVSDVVYSENEAIRITILYTITYVFDNLLQILLVYVELKDKLKEKIISLIMLITQCITMWVYAIIIVPSILKSNNDRLIAYGAIFGFSIIMGIINYLIYKLYKKNKAKGPKVIVYNSRLEKERQIKREQERQYRREHKKELIVCAIVIGFLILFWVIAYIVILNS